eukprot:GHRR01019750.1.p1 GENE.GHRR01019750.1~~GHRR01019750.1.p1  ORF type:complete len:306 (+),score=95.45 GHRR01019750.1:1476-2393(+)
MQALRGLGSRCNRSGAACSCKGRQRLAGQATRQGVSRLRTIRAQASLKALVFDCDGVILESEDLHRRAYNATFQHFNVQCGVIGLIDWDEQFYDMLQNTVGGGKPKMRWYFNRQGWPTSSVLSGRAPSNEQEQALLIDTLQDWKTEKYQQMIGSGEVVPRPGVLRLMDEARSAGLKVAVCSAATKSSVVFTLKSLLGEQRFSSLDCFLAGDDVDKKKPDPTIYRIAAGKLGVDPSECVVVEDSSIGLQAALEAGMRCIITYTPSTKQQVSRAVDTEQPSQGWKDVQPVLTVLFNMHSWTLGQWAA